MSLKSELCLVEGAGEDEQEGVKELVTLLPGPHRRPPVPIAHCHGLHGDARPKASGPKPGEASAISGGALREHEHLGPGLLGENPLCDLLRGLLPAVLAPPV